MLTVNKVYLIHSPRSLLVECFKYIFLHLVGNGQQKDLNIASRFLKVLQACVYVDVGVRIV